MHDEGRQRRGRGGLRAVGLRQVDPDQDRERAGALPEGRHRGQRHFRGRSPPPPAQAAGGGGHGVPALRTVPAPVGDREPVPGPGQGAAPEQGRGPRAGAVAA
ncbi:hypothetical protein G6F57_020776 [Rhizopus arrhizus]|nr:hypothetical protein G6F57_020776 [Rhizopus arrhizus]